MNARHAGLAVLLTLPAAFAYGQGAHAQGPSVFAPIPPSGNAEAFVARLPQEGERNRVLNDMEIGARSFWAGQYDQAKPALDDAITRIEAVYANNADATKARSLWYEESVKLFKGEPYERVMAYYYRGLLYLHDGDYENARAAFRSGQLQDAFAEEQQYQCDFGVMLFLEAWASHLNHDYDLRDETLTRLKKLRPDFPGIGPHDDTLVLVETGSAPRKLGDGAEHAFFVYRRGKGFTETRAAVVTPSGETPIYPMEDVFWQASTRGGRQVDRILNGKVQFQESAVALSTTLMTGSQIALGVQELGGGGTAGTVAGVLGGIGALSYLIAANAKPTADTRTWTSLPDTIHIMTLSSREAVTAGLAVRFKDPSSNVVGADKPLTFDRDRHGAQIGLVRSR